MSDTTTKATHGHVLDILPTFPAGSARCCVTSPPYWGLRDYGTSPVHWPAVTFSPMAGLPTLTIPEQDASLGLEPDQWAYIGHLVAVFREVRRVMTKDGTLWLNLGDSYAANRTYQVTPTKWPTLEQGQPSSVPSGLKPKDLVGIPWRVAFALQADGWWLRMDNIWHKPNPMPESVTDRPTKAHEYVFLLSRSAHYYYDVEAVKEPQAESPAPRRRRQDLREKPGWADAYHGNPPTGLARKQDGAGGRRYEGFNGRWDAAEAEGTAPSMRNLRSVWTIATEPCAEAHFATMPTAIAERCILAGSAVDDVVLDPFAGAGTTLAVARRLGRRGIGAELNPAYLEIQDRRIEKAGGYQTSLLG